MKAVVILGLIVALLAVTNGLTLWYAAALRARAREVEAELGTALTRLESIKTQVVTHSVDTAKGGLDWLINHLNAVKSNL